MAIDKLELLFKKVFAGKASTDNNRAFYEEPGVANGRLSVFSTNVWSEAQLIPNSGIADLTSAGDGGSVSEGVITYYSGSELGYIQGTGTDGTAFSSSYQDWIPFNFGDGSSYNYILTDANNTRIFDTDSSNWTFDTETGVLIFHDALPTGVDTSTNLPKISGYVYTGKKLNTGLVTGEVSASGALFASLSLDATTTNKTVMYDTATGKFFYTGSYGGGGSGDPGVSSYNDLTDVPAGIISSSAQTIFFTAANATSSLDAISGSVHNLTEASKSFSTRVTDLKTDSGSFSTRLTALTNGTANLDVSTITVGDLTVDGTLTAIQTTNLDVTDAFIRVASASAGTNVDGGLFIQSGSATNTGSAFYHDSGDQRWKVAKHVPTSETDISSNTNISSSAVVTVATANRAPIESDVKYGAGEIYLDTQNNDIYIRL